MNIRVLHILSGDLWGGAEAQMGLQIRAQRELGLDSRVLLFNEGETKKRYLEFAIPLEVVEEKSGILHLFTAALKISRDFKPQIIVSHGYKETFVASYLSIVSKIPFLSTIHGGTESYRGVKAVKSYFYSALSLFLAKNLAKSTIVPTFDLQKQLNLDGAIIGNVADVSLSGIDPLELRSRLGLDVNLPLVIWVGRIVPVKRIDRAIRAVFELQKNGIRINLAIVGTGVLQGESQDLVRSLGLEAQIKFLGFRADAGLLIGAADLLLLTSESEGLPTVMAEAMTQGTKLVMSDLAGIKEIAQKFNNYPLKLISPQTPEAFAAGIKDSLARNEPIQEELLEDVRNWFNPLRAAKESAEIYRGILGNF